MNLPVKVPEDAPGGSPITRIVDADIHQAKIVDLDDEGVQGPYSPDLVGRA
jgi:hypothetical protein